MFKYLFDVPGKDFKYYTVFLVILAIVFAGSFFCQYRLKKHDKLVKRHFEYIPSRMRTISILFALSLFARYNNAVYFSTRFFFYLIAVFTIYSIAKALYIYFYSYTKDKKRFQTITKNNNKEYSTKKKKR